VRQHLKELTRREARLAEDLARVVRQARRGEITPAEKRAFEADIAAERQEIESRRQALEGSMAGPQRGCATPGANPWEALPPQTRREVLRLLLDRLVLYKPKGQGLAPQADFYWRA
jgi:hypothetical protein